MKDEELKAVAEANPGAKLTVLSHPEGAEVVVRRPTRIEWKRFQQQCQDESKQFSAGEFLLSSCVVHPSKEAFQAMIEDAPGLYNTFLKGLTAHAGATDKFEKKALSPAT